MDEFNKQKGIRKERTINVYVRPMTESEYSEVVRLFASRYEDQEIKKKEVT